MFGFKKHDPRVATERERIKKESQQRYDEAVGSAQVCLNMDEFKKYREQYELLERIVIEELIELDKTEFEPARYGFQCKDIVSKLRHIGVLLRGVKSDAGKKV